MKTKVGIPHFKGTLKKARSSDYSFQKAILDIIDNAIFKCSNIRVNLDFSSNQIYGIMISDNYKHGFENINDEGEENPFNMAHVKDSHQNDEETSEFGMGLKLASIFLGNKLTVLTKVGNEYYQIAFDFEKMCSIEDPNKSYEPSVWTIITQDVYKQLHPFDYGSSIILEKLCPKNYSFDDKENTITKFQNWIQDAYSKILLKKDINIKIICDEKEYPVDPIHDFFEDSNCKPFNMKSEVAIFDDKIICKTTHMKGALSYYSNTDETSNSAISSIKKETYEDFLKDKSYLSMLFKSTITVFKGREIDNITRGNINFYRYDRKYGCLSYKKHRNNGSQNYTIHNIEYSSKKINSMIGMNYNKGINESITSPLTKFLAEIQKIHEGKYSSDTSNKIFRDLNSRAIELKIIEPELIESNEEDDNLQEEDRRIEVETRQTLDTTNNETVDSAIETIDSANETVDSANETVDSANETVDNTTNNETVDSANEIVDNTINNETVDNNFDTVDSANETDDINQSNIYENINTIVYYGIKKDDKYDTKIPVLNGYMKGKIGYTKQSISKRFSGGGLEKGWEHVYYDEISETYETKDDNDKIRSENILIECISKLDYVIFVRNSKEIFSFPFEKRFEIKDIIIETLKQHRP